MHFSGPFACYMATYWLFCAWYAVRDSICSRNDTQWHASKGYRRVPADLWSTWRRAAGVSARNHLVALGISRVWDRLLPPTHMDDAWPVLLAKCAAAFVLYDVGFYCLHRLMHRPRWYARWHAQHHESPHVMVAAAGGRASLGTHLLEIGWLALLTRLLFLSPNSVAALGVLSAWAQTSSHSGYVDERTGARDWHEVHHTRVTCNYGVGLYVCDRLFGTLVVA